ncbi:helix-turn-helix domain-containing protein [Alkalibacillus sp. S2W]|uniref:helix-turn-helix domain-containing protein n=1 Tax=Alkalibacillus sp. S2W TaxID=3386553 RepID=UPI00398D3C88
MEVGERLKEAREAKGLTIEQLAQETKIQKRYLSAIEEHDWSTLPGNFYIRAFVREYANAVGLNGEELLDEHANELPTVSEPTSQQYMTPSRSAGKSGKKNKQMFSMIPKLLVFILLIGVGFAIWYSVVNFIQPAMTDDSNNNNSEEIISAPEEDENNQEENTNDENSNQEENSSNEEGNNDSSQDNNSNNEDEESEEESKENSEPEISVANVDESGTPTTTYEVAHNGPIEITLNTDDETWLQVNISENGSTSQPISGMFNTDNAPETFTYENSSGEMELVIGLASAFTVEVNGQPIEYEINPNDTVRQNVIIQWQNEES